MITCIVNPSRCGSTWLQHIIDKHFMLTGLNDYSMEYEIIDHANGMHVIDNPPSKTFYLNISICTQTNLCLVQINILF